MAEKGAADAAAGRPHRWLREFGGAFGDMGTFLPYVLGALTVGGLAAPGVLAGFGLFLIATGLIYGLPLAVQPMKAVTAVVLAEGMTPGEVAATGMILGVILVALTLTGALRRIVRWIPGSVTSGLQLGLGLSMGLLGLGLIAETPWLGGLTLVIVLLLLRWPVLPAAPLALIAAIAAGMAAGTIALPSLDPGIHPPGWVRPGWYEAMQGFALGVLPQLPLTLTNAVIVTAALARDLFPGSAGRVTEQRLALSTGCANLLLAPLGALPMCHGAGGLQAQHRFGARTGAAPVMLGILLLGLGLFGADDAQALLAAVPAGAGGALLLVAGVDLALSRRLFDARPSCRPVIGSAALLTLILNPAVGLVAGMVAEQVRARVVRLRYARRRANRA